MSAATRRLVVAGACCLAPLVPTDETTTRDARALRVVVVGADAVDARFAATREAVQHWNALFAELELERPFADAEFVRRAVPEDLLAAYSRMALRRDTMIRSPNALTEMPGDVVIVLSDSAIVSFAAPLAPPGRRLIGIRTGRLPPLSLPNVTRNVVAHELGHVLGLGHNADPQMLMCGRPAACRPGDFRSEEPRIFDLTEAERERLRQLHRVSRPPPLGTPVLPVAHRPAATNGERQTRVLADIPFRLVDGYVLFRARIDESEELTVLFDTGCGQLVIHSVTAERLGLTVRSVTRHDGVRPVEGHVVEGVRMSLGGLTLGPLDALRRDHDLLRERLGVSIDAVIGADLLRDFVVGIDFDRMRMTVYASDGFAYTGPGTGHDIVSTPHVATTMATVTLGDGQVLTGRFLIDTGAGVTVALNTPFVNRHDLLRRIGVPHIRHTLVAESTEMVSHPGRIARFAVGDRALDDLPVVLSQSDIGPLSAEVIAGIIGNQVWRRFNTTFDYGRNRLYLAPNQSYGEPFAVDGSGLTIVPAPAGGFLVRTVVEGSPAAEAGIQAGDVIVEVDGADAGAVALHEARAMLARDGTTVTLLLDRGGLLPLRVSLPLRRQF